MCREQCEREEAEDEEDDRRIDCRRRGDRGLAVRALRERGDRILVEEPGEEADGVARGPQRHDAQADVRLLHPGDRPREGGHVVRSGLEVAHEQDRSLGDLVPLEHRLRELERDGDLCPGAERLRPRIPYGPEARRDEQPEHGLELGRGRARREQLVGNVGEDGETDGRVLRDEAAQRPPDPHVVVVRDAEGEVEHDDPDPVGRNERLLARLRVARGGGRRQDQGDRPAREHEADEARPPDDGAEAADLVRVDGSRRARPVGEDAL